MKYQGSKNITAMDNELLNEGKEEMNKDVKSN